MSKIFTVIIERIVSTITATVSGTVAVTTVKPDGTNTQPSMDTAARRGYQQITDGTNLHPVGDVPARAPYFIATAPNVTKKVVSHGVVAATWTADNANCVGLHATLNTYITGISIYCSDDPTAEVAIQPIPLTLILMDYASGGGILGATFSIGSSPATIILPIPLLVLPGNTQGFSSALYLGGATALTLAIYYWGYSI